MTGVYSSQGLYELTFQGVEESHKLELSRAPHEHAVTNKIIVPDNHTIVGFYGVATSEMIV